MVPRSDGQIVVMLHLRIGVGAPQNPKPISIASARIAVGILTARLVMSSVPRRNLNFAKALGSK